jgi:cytochrome P450
MTDTGVAIDRSAASANALVVDQALAVETDRAIREIPASQLRSPDGLAPGLDPQVSLDPFTAFARLRDVRGDVVAYADGAFGDVRTFNPFGHDPDRPIFAVLGYDAIKQMLMDPLHFINADSYGAHGKAGGRVMVNELDGDVHRLMRRIFDGDIFGRRRLVEFAEGSIAPMAQYLTLRIKDMLAAGEPVDMSRDLALPLVYSSMARIIGVPISDLSYFVKTSEAAFSGNRDMKRALAAVQELSGFFETEYQRRLTTGVVESDDLISLMRAVDREGFRFSADEIIAYCRFLLPAGIETTWRQMANLCYATLGHRDQYRALVADPKLRPAAVEEGLRWMSSGFILPRICGVDTVLADVEIPAGSGMCGVFGVANRDPRVWENGDNFDILRKKIPHLTFSTGSHFCMGQNLARQIFTKGLDAIAENLPNITLTKPWQEIETTGLVIRCANEVPVYWDSSYFQ